MGPSVGSKRLEKKTGHIANLDIVQELCRLYKVSKAKLVWVRAHVGTEGNELADEWANKARSEKLDMFLEIND